MISEVQCTLQDRELISPVTALEFDEETKLLVGEGPYLKIYESTFGELIATERVFDNQCIHSIELHNLNGATRTVISGGRAVAVLSVQNKAIETINKVLFTDWIWDTCLLQGSLSEEQCCVAVVTGHNAVWIWNIREDMKWKVSQCEEQCILYSARFIGRTLEHMWLACGTVFNEVLLWKVAEKNTNGRNVPVRQCLRGHDGVIFSVQYNYKRQLLCSVSDDRSIKVWSARFENDYSDIEVSPKPLLTLYGHKARVWDCLILKQHFVSVGEDSTCLLWDADGKIIQSWRGHIGKSIWSLACDADERFVVTGGGDGAIRLWHLEDDIKESKKEQHSFSNIPSQEEIPRLVGLLHDSSVLVVTDKGNLHNFVFENQFENSGMWKLIRSEPDFSSYSIMALSDCRTIVALGNISGTVKLISLNDPNWCSYSRKLYAGKVLSLHWFVDDRNDYLSLFSCGPEGLVIWWSVQCLKDSQSFNCEIKAKFRLPYCKQRWPNSVFVHHHDGSFDSDSSLVLCGDRRGSLHVFKATTENEPKDPVQSLIGIHGRNGVTSICKNSEYIYTTGRDGYMRQYKLCRETIELLDKKKVYKGMEWIAQVQFNSDGEVLVCGFHTIARSISKIILLKVGKRCFSKSKLPTTVQVNFVAEYFTEHDKNKVFLRIPAKWSRENALQRKHACLEVDFIIWSMTRNKVLFRVPCGGGHRNWDIILSKIENGTSTLFTYLKQTTVHVHNSSEVTKLSPSIIQKSFHGREINCVRFLGSLKRKENQFQLLATGSEDTTINIMLYNPKKMAGQRFLKLFSCEGHISSVRCLAFIKPSQAIRTRSHGQCLRAHEDHSRAREERLRSHEQYLHYHDDRHKHLLFSGGSRASLKCWSLDIESTSDKDEKGELSTSLNSSCTLLAELRSPSRRKKSRSTNEFPCDVRFMSLSVFSLTDLVRVWSDVSAVGVIAGCSDGLVRLYMFDYEQKLFTLIGRGISNEKCLLCVGHILHSTHLIVYACDTAGFISFWDMTDICIEHFSRFNQDNTTDESHPFDTKCEESFNSDSTASSCSKTKEHVSRPFYCEKLHQSGVNSIHLVLKEKKQYLLCSGGDDGAVAFASFEIHSTDNKITICSWNVVLVPDAHISATTGVKLFDSDFAVSASVDQRLKIWKIHWTFQDAIVSNVTLIDSYLLDVADVQDIDLQPCINAGSHRVVASGVGMQLLLIKLFKNSHQKQNEKDLLKTDSL